MGWFCLHLSYSPPDVNFALDVYVIKGLLAESLLAERAGATGDGAGSWTLGKDAVHT